MTDPALLSILCCPETHQPLHPADQSVIESLNRQIAAGQLRYRSGQSVTEKIEAGFVRQDGEFLYPVRNHLPILLIGEALPLDKAATS